MFTDYFQRISEKNRYLIILVGTVLLFILALLPHSFGWIFFKVLFALALISFIILQYQTMLTEEPGSEDELDLEETIQTRQDWLQIENDQDVEDLFQKFLESTLQLVKKVLVSNTVILLFANYNKKEFTIRYRVSDFPDVIIPQNNIDIYKGLPSLVLRNRNPLIENHLPDGPEILPYYKINENPSRSFAAVPIYFSDKIIGVLCADSGVEEAYSNDDLEILKHFGQLITIQLFGSNKLYEYESENWLANVLFDVSQQMNRIQSVHELWEYLVKKLPDIVPCDRISVSRKINEKQGQIVNIQGGTGNLKPAWLFSINEGIVGWVMRKNQTLLVDDFSQKENYVPRFGTSETPSREYLSLLALPLAADNKIIAVLCLESYRPRNFKEQHKRILQTICNQAATMYLTTQTLDSLKSMNYKDEETRIENMNAFRFILPKEIKRASRLGYPVNMIFIKLYYQAKENDPEIRVKTLQEFLSLVLPNLSDSDYIFRLLTDTFAVIRSSNNEQETLKVAEKIMNKLTEKKIWAEGQAIDFYVNMGILPKKFITDDVDSMIQLGDESIKNSRLLGPNKIAVYRQQTEDENRDIESLPTQ
ncbi:MAG: GAF domain-containing protein [Calditrichaeota bacterium]|nr:GAF domain-containing protein [Calditrichota bacterium]